MKKSKFIVLGAIVAAMLAFTACGGNDDATDPTTAPAPVTEASDVHPEGGQGQVTGQTQGQPEVPPVRGVWNDNEWRSDYLGITFTLLPGWSASSDADIAEALGLGLDVMEAFGVTVPEGISSIGDMMAVDPIAGASVLIAFERLDEEWVGITAAEYAEFLALGVTMIGATTESGLPFVRIGNYEWYQLSVTQDFGEGVVVHSRYFFNLAGNFARVVTVSYLDGYPHVEAVLSSLGVSDI